MMKRKVLRVISICTLFVMLSVFSACSKGNDDSLKDVDSPVVQNEVDSQDASKDETEDEDTTKTPEEVEKADDSTKGSDDSADKDEANQDDQTAKTDTVLVGDRPLVEGGIRGVYEKLNMTAGTCINNMVISQPKFSDHIKENYNRVTMENDMKPDYSLNRDKSIAADDIVVEFNDATKKMLEWAKTNGILVRGHTIVWHSQTPQWIFHEAFDTSKPKVSREIMLKRMESYIKQVFEQLDSLGYLDIFYSYDVVNEAIEDNGTLRDSNWRQVIGDDYIWYAFYFADKYAPEHVKLYYNDFNEQFKTQYIVDLAKSLVDENGRSFIDGIGCQAHLYTQDSIDEYMKTMEAFSATGLEVQVTEIDVSLGTWTNILQPTEENLLVQGRYYYELINRIIEANKAGTTNISGITFWGISDYFSWRRERSPLLFDKELKAKYSYFGAAQVREYAGY